MAVQRRVTRWIWVSLGALVIVGMAVASALSDSPHWDKALAWAEHRRQVWLADGCPVVGGEAVDGCSRDDYRRAVELVAQWSEALKDRVMASRDQEAGRMSATAAEVAEVVGVLLRGARRIRDVEPGVERLGSGAENELLDVGSLWLALAALTVTMRAPGIDRLELLPDALVVVADLASSGIGLERLSAEAELRRLLEAVTDDVLRAGDEEQLARVAHAVDAVAGALPPGSDFIERELVHWIAYASDSLQLSKYLDFVPRWRTWKHGFSREAWVVDVVSDHWHLVTECNRGSGSGEPWPVRRARLEALQDDLRREVGDAGAFGLPNVVSLEWQMRQTRAALHQLQMALAFHRGLPVPQAIDPLGAEPMQCEIDGDRATFRSADPDFQRVAERAR